MGFSFLSSILIISLLLLNYLHRKEIEKLKRLFTFDEETLLVEAKKLVSEKSALEAIKELRTRHYPLSLLKAKQIVDQASGKEKR